MNKLLTILLLLFSIPSYANFADTALTPGVNDTVESYPSLSFESLSIHSNIPTASNILNRRVEVVGYIVPGTTYKVIEDYEIQRGFVIDRFGLLIHIDDYNAIANMSTNLDQESVVELLVEASLGWTFLGAVYGRSGYKSSFRILQ